MKANRFCTYPWALLPAAWQQIKEAHANEVPFHAAMPSFAPSPLLKELAERHPVAVLPIRGVILPYQSALATLLGATCLDVLTQDFCQARDNPDICAIVLDIDSPGGMVTGVHAFSQQVFAARSIKPMIAMVSGMAASAAYWIAASATHLYLDPTASVGSIGVVMTYTDTTQQEEKAGVRRMEIVSSQSPYKRVNAASDEGRAQLQAQVDALGSVFIEAVATYRNTPVTTVLSDFGQGGLVVGAAAVQHGMADGLSTLPSLFTHFISTHTGANVMSSTITDQTPKALRLSENPPKPILAASLGAASQEVQSVEWASPEVSYNQGVEVGILLGKTQERERMASIEAQSLPGHEALIARLKADGVSTGSDAALQILAAEKAQRIQMAAALEQDAPAVLPPVLDSERRAYANLPLEAQCEAEWQNSPQVREEFYSYEGYVAYRKAEASGLIKHYNR